MKLTEQYLQEVTARCISAQPGPWKAYIEGRDHQSGSDFIMTDSGENGRRADMEITGATTADYDFIANAKQDIPKLVKEIYRLRSLVDE